MAEAIKSIRRISKKLQETFKTICYYTSRHLSRTEKYKSQFIDEYKKISSKLRSDAKKTKSRDHKKHIQQKQRLKKQLAELKQKRKNQDRDKRNSRKEDEQKSNSSMSSYKQKNKYDIKNKKKNQKQKQKQQRKQRQQKQDNRNQPKRKISALQKQRQLDFDRDFDFKKPYYREPNNTIYQEQQDDIKIKQVPKKKKKQNQKGWNQKQMDSIGPSDPQKYKIMKVSQQTSDFQDSNAPQKVPSIKPRQPLTPYFLFLRYNRFSIAESYPAIERKRSFSKIWKQLPQEQKATYQQQYRRSQQVYAKKLMQFYAVNPRSIQQKHRITQQIQKVARKQKPQQRKQPKKRGRSSKNKTPQKEDDQYEPKQQKPKQKRQSKKKKEQK